MLKNHQYLGENTHSLTHLYTHTLFHTLTVLHTYSPSYIHTHAHTHMHTADQAVLCCRIDIPNTILIFCVFLLLRHLVVLGIQRWVFHRLGKLFTLSHTPNPWFLGEKVLLYSLGQPGI